MVDLLGAVAVDAHAGGHVALCADLGIADEHLFVDHGVLADLHGSHCDDPLLERRVPLDPQVLGSLQVAAGADPGAVADLCAVASR